MQYVLYLCFLATLCNNLFAGVYTNSLSAVIAEKIEFLEQSSYEIKNIQKIERKLAKIIKKQPSAQDVNSFLDHKNSIVSFFDEQLVLKLNGDISQEAQEVLQNFKDLKFAIYARLYLYYLTCCKEMILYKATRNYDALQYWKNELFAENLPFYNKNILRWISQSSYQERIERNIADLEKVSFETNSFLGMLCSNENLLLQSQTEQDFKDNLKEVIGIQNELLQVTDDLSYEDMGHLLKGSLKQVDDFNNHLSELYAQCQLPSHVARNWKAYTISTATMCACAYIYLHYGNAIIQSAQYAWNEHARGPIEKAVQTFTGVLQPDQIDIEDFKQSLIVSEQAAAQRPFPKGKDDSLHESLASSFDEMTGGQAGPIIQEIKDLRVVAKEVATTVVPMVNRMGPVIDETVPVVKDVLDVYHNQFRPFVATNRDATIMNPFANATPIEAIKNSFNLNRQIWLGQNLKGVDAIINGPGKEVVSTFKPLELPDSLQASVQEIVVPKIDQQAATPKTYPENMSQKDKDDIILGNSLKNSNDFVDAGRREALRLVIKVLEKANKMTKDNHMVMSMAALLPAATIVGGSLFASKNIYNSVVYQSIRKFVRELDVLLNDALYRQPSFDIQGQLYFLVEQLALNIDVLTLGEQKMIQEDLRSLRNYGLDYVQKYNVIARMYKTYPCLRAGGA